MIRYYLNEDPVLDNVETLLMSDTTSAAARLGQPADFVVKAVGESGGYGMLIGPHSTAVQRDEFRRRIVADPRNYIAQPVLACRRAPCFLDGAVQPRHVDLRPYILFGERRYYRPGGLTRVALKKVHWS